MGYLHIPNLYRPEAQRILEFKRVFACEKVHGTSAHIRFKDGQLGFFSGGESHDKFVALFQGMDLEEKLQAKFTAADSIVIYGEAYGGKQQGMSHTYGPNLKFVAFDVKINDSWLAVDQAAGFVAGLGLEFVDYVLIPSTLEAIDFERDRPSTQAIRNGITEPKIREGIVLRPPFEVTLNHGERLIVKHKRDEFRETKTARVVDKMNVLKYRDVAEEFVTAMRLEHVIGQLVATREDKTVEMKDIPDLNRLMIADVLREGAGEIEVEDVKSFNKSISAATVKLLKAKLEQALRSHQ